MVTKAVKTAVFVAVLDAFVAVLAVFVAVLAVFVVVLAVFVAVLAVFVAIFDYYKLGVTINWDIPLTGFRILRTKNFRSYRS